MEFPRRLAAPASEVVSQLLLAGILGARSIGQSKARLQRSVGTGGKA